MTHPAAPLLRFAVLQHSGIDEPHFDFLFEISPTSDLITFRLSEWPLSKPERVQKLRDHRRLYLTYEGPVPGERGRVDRMAEGLVDVAFIPEGLRLAISEGSPLIRFERDASAQPEEWWAFPGVPRSG